MAEMRRLVPLNEREDGSIILPALASALYALKPTVGLISRAGVVPLATYFDTPGPLAKCVWDLGTLMDVVCAVDGDDPTSKFFFCFLKKGQIALSGE